MLHPGNIGILIAALLVPIALRAAEPVHARSGHFIDNSGVNLPWMRYGWDLGEHPWGGRRGGIPNRADELDRQFAFLNTNGVRLCRVFLFCDFRTGIRYGTEGKVEGLGPHVIDDMRALVGAARHHNLRLLPVLMDYTLADGVSTEGDTPVGEHPEFVTNAAVRSDVIRKVLAPFVREFADDTTIRAWEIMNEPRLATAVSSNALQRFVGECADALRKADPDTPLTVGSYDRFHLDQYGADAMDLVQVHYYEHMTNYWRFGTDVTNVSARPVLFGEVPPARAAARLTSALTNGYEGVLFWSLNAPYRGAGFRDVAAEYKAWVERAAPVPDAE